jgi:hypothetical protein
MTEGASGDAAQFLARQIERAKTLRKTRASDPAHKARRARLRQWQAARLAATHKDLLGNPRYRSAAQFFLSDLYGIEDTSKRDADVERIYPVMVRMLPERALHSIGIALELDALTEELDEQLLTAIRSKEMTEAAYVEAYRRCDNYALRKHQIALITEIGQHLCEMVNKPLLYKALRAMRVPARLAGFGELQDFLERGFAAFLQIDDPQEFLSLIEQRETQILDRIYAGHSSPFEVAGRERVRGQA